MKHLIKITHTTQAKNKLQEMIAQYLMGLDQSLWDSDEKAKFVIYEAFDKAMASYTGKCTFTRPTQQKMIDDEKGFLIYVGELMVIAVYAVIEDMPAFYTNRQLYSRIEQSSARVEKIFSIAGGYDSSDLKEFLNEDVDDDFFVEFFPNAPIDEIIEAIDFGESVASVLLHHGYYGYLVKFLVPERDNFTFQEGTDRYISCRVGGMISHLRYAYLEDIAQLGAEATRIGKECLALDIKRFKEQQAKQENGTN